MQSENENRSRALKNWCMCTCIEQGLNCWGTFLRLIGEGLAGSCGGEALNVNVVLDSEGHPPQRGPIC